MSSPTLFWTRSPQILLHWLFNKVQASTVLGFQMPDFLKPEFWGSNPDAHVCGGSILQTQTSCQLWQVTFETQSLSIFWPHSLDARILSTKWEDLKEKERPYRGRFSGLKMKEVKCVQPSQEAVSLCKGAWKNVISLWSWSVMKSFPESLANSARVCFSRLALSFIWKNLQSLTPLRQENVWMMKHALSDVLSRAHVLPLECSRLSTCFPSF